MFDSAAGRSPTARDKFLTSPKGDTLDLRYQNLTFSKTVDNRGAQESKNVRRELFIFLITASLLAIVLDRKRQAFIASRKVLT